MYTYDTQFCKLIVVFSSFFKWNLRIKFCAYSKIQYKSDPDKYKGVAQ